MKETLVNKLLQYIRENNPDLLLQLEEESKVREYLSDKMCQVDTLLNQSEKDQPAYIIEEACMDILTEDLKPSKYNYICKILEEEFSGTYQKLQQPGTLQFEVINMIMYCQPVFDKEGFSKENEESRVLQYAITGAIKEYFEMNIAKENLPNGRQV
jgi:hypothetical protein